MKKIIQQIFHQAALNPNELAIHSGDQSITHAELEKSIKQTSGVLKKESVQRIGLYLDNSIEWIVTDLACAYSDTLVIPLPLFFSAQQLQHAVKTAGLDGIVASNEFPHWLKLTGKPSALSQEIMLHHIKEAKLTKQNLNISKVSYTSGSTGSPKGIELSNKMIDAVCDSLTEVTQHLDVSRHLSLLPYSTLLENIGGIYVPLSQGKTVYAEPSSRLGLSSTLDVDAAQLATTFNSICPNSLIVTPQLLKLLCTLAENQLINTSHLQFVAVGGARVGLALLNRSKGLGIPVFEGYGLTEACSVATLNSAHDYRAGSVGKPLSHVSPTFTDEGELIINFKPSPLNEASAEVRTGDIGYQDDDGFIHITGRKKNVIVLSTGRNVSPEWIEGELNYSPLIAQSFVFGESKTNLSALILPQTKGIEKAELEHFIHSLNKRLPPYARIAQWHPLEQGFSTANGTLTSNGRLRREAIFKVLPLLTRKASHVSSHSLTFKESASC